MHRLPYLFLVVFAGSGLHSQVTVDVTGTLNRSKIDSVVYEINGVDVFQNSPATSSINLSSPVNVKQIVLTSEGSTPVLRPLNFYNTANAIILNNNFQANTGSGVTTGGVGVFDTSEPTRVRIEDDGLSAFEEAVIKTTLNLNLLNYIFYDGSLSNMPASNVADFDVLYRHAWTTDDFLVVAERDGNTFFELQPLGIDGNPISGANTLRFGDPSAPASTQPHDWNSGYGNEFDGFNTQYMWFTAASVELFFDGTGVLPEDQLVFGFRIDNNGNADVKFFGASDDPFTNNPENPLVPIPEPAAAASVLGLAALVFLWRRRRACGR